MLFYYPRGIFQYEFEEEHLREDKAMDILKLHLFVKKKKTFSI
jgi:hypothetical protein